MEDTDKLTLERRLFFVEADEALIAPEAVETHKAQLLDIMQAFKKRKMEYNESNGVEHSPAESTTASYGGASVGGESDDDFVPSSAWEVAPATPPSARTSDIHGGYTEEEWELWFLREENERLRGEEPMLAETASAHRGPNP